MWNADTTDTCACVYVSRLTEGSPGEARPRGLGCDKSMSGPTVKARAIRPSANRYMSCRGASRPHDTCVMSSVPLRCIDRSRSDRKPHAQSPRCCRCTHRLQLATAQPANTLVDSVHRSRRVSGGAEYHTENTPLMDERWGGGRRVTRANMADFGAADGRSSALAASTGSIEDDACVLEPSGSTNSSHEPIM